MGKLNEICEVEIIYKRPIVTSMELVICAEDSVELFRKLIPEEKMDFKEFFLVALLSRNNRVLGIANIGMGNSHSTIVNVIEIFQLAIKTNASSIILCHNHPSGSLKPSESDITITKKIKEACALCDISLLDHIILTSEGHNSFIGEI